MNTKLKPHRKTIARMRGHVLVGALILVGASAILVAVAMRATGTQILTTRHLQDAIENQHEAEATLNLALSWLRQNSSSLALAFGRNSFYTVFDRTAPSAGANDSGNFTVPSKLRLQGSGNAPILTNSPTLGTAAFPATTDALTGANFNPAAAFSSGSYGNALVRITLVDAVAIDPTKDFGDPDSGNAAPQTDFQPVYRIDSMTSADQGSHLYGYLSGTLVLDYGIGFYGNDSLELRQSCDSYVSNAGPYADASKRANCTAGSRGNVQVHQDETIYGSVRTTAAVDSVSPYGGPICADFTSGCPNPGTTCQGASCTVAGLPAYSTWDTYCPTNQGDLTISSSQTLTVPGNAASQKCWNSVTIDNNRVLTLSSTSYPYFIDTLNIANNARLNFSPSPGTGTINLYVRTIVGDRFNGNQIFNINNKPYQFRLHYLGNNALTMNGTAAMNAFLVAPYAAVSVQGNFTYSGGIKALTLNATGSGDLHYDESGDITTISDTSYRLKQVEAYYR